MNAEVSLHVVDLRFQLLELRYVARVECEEVTVLCFESRHLAYGTEFRRLLWVVDGSTTTADSEFQPEAGALHASVGLPRHLLPVVLLPIIVLAVVAATVLSMGATVPPVMVLADEVRRPWSRRSLVAHQHFEEGAHTRGRELHEIEVS